MVSLRRAAKAIKYGFLGCFGIKEQKCGLEKGDRLPYDVAWALDERCISRPMPYGERMYRHGNLNKSYHDTTRSGNTPNMHYAFYMEFPPTSSSPAAIVAA